MIDRPGGAPPVRRTAHEVGVGAGVNLHVVEVSIVDDGPPVLLLHGLGIGGLYWDLPVPGYSTAESLAARGLRAFAVDHRGYGRSSPVPGHTVRVERATDDVGAVIDFVRGETGGAEVCLVGHSWGAMVAAVTAYRRPEGVASLVLIGMPYRRIHPEFQQQLAELEGALEPTDGWIQNVTHIGLQDYLYSYDPDALDAYTAIVDREYPSIPTGILRDCLELPHADSAARVERPVLVVYGTLEDVVERTDMLDLLDDLPAADKDLLVVGNAGHLMGLEKLSHRRIDRAVADWAIDHAGS
jgi:pimeloyl-ACP methyl ester carboxylesterase